MLSLPFALQGGGSQPRWSESDCGVSGGPGGPRDMGGLGGSNGPGVLKGP